MLITGVFWGTWFPLTRSLESFSSDEFIHIGKVIIANVAMPMRIILPSGILMMILSLWLYGTKKTLGFTLGLVSLLLIIIVLAITLIVLVPIDNNIKNWTAATTPQDWQLIRYKWQTFHAMRTFASLASFACFSLFVTVGELKNKQMAYRR